MRQVFKYMTNREFLHEVLEYTALIIVGWLLTIIIFTF